MATGPDGETAARSRELDPRQAGQLDEAVEVASFCNRENKDRRALNPNGHGPAPGGPYLRLCVLPQSGQAVNLLNEIFFPRQLLLPARDRIR